MKKELVDGYLYEVTKSLSRKDRKKIYESLESEIYEKIQIRKKGEVETNEEILSVLEEYGNPADIAQKYASNGRKAVIPQPHFTHYNRDKFLAYFAGILAFLGMVFFSFAILQKQVFGFDFALDMLAIVILIFVIFVSYTLTFSWVSGIRLKSWSKFSKAIKPEPTKGSRISSFEIKFQVILAVVTFVIFAFGNTFLGINYNGINLGNGYMLLLIVPIVVAYFLNTLNVAYKEVDKRYTLGVLFTTIISNLFILTLAFLIFVRDKAVSEGFKSWLTSLLPTNELMANLVNNLGLVIFVIVLLFAAIDTISTAFGFHSNTKDGVEGIYKNNEALRDEKDMFENNSNVTIQQTSNNEDTNLEDFNKSPANEEAGQNAAAFETETVEAAKPNKTDEAIDNTIVLNKKDMALEEKTSNPIADFMRKNNK